MGQINDNKPNFGLILIIVFFCIIIGWQLVQHVAISDYVPYEKVLLTDGRQFVESWGERPLTMYESQIKSESKQRWVEYAKYQNEINNQLIEIKTQYREVYHPWTLTDILITLFSGVIVVAGVFTIVSNRNSKSYDEESK